MSTNHVLFPTELSSQLVGQTGIEPAPPGLPGALHELLVLPSLAEHDHAMRTVPVRFTSLDTRPREGGARVMAKQGGKMAAGDSYWKLRCEWRIASSEWRSSEDSRRGHSLFAIRYSLFAIRYSLLSLRRRCDWRARFFDAMHEHCDRSRPDHEAERDDGRDPEHEIETAAPVEERNQRHRGARHHEGQEITHRKDARAPGVGRVACDHEIIHRNLRIDSSDRDRERHH